MIRRIDQQIKVNKMMIDYMAEQKSLPKNLRKYMMNYLTIITTVSSIMLIRSNTEENFEKKIELWKYMKSKDYKMYMQVRCSLLGRLSNLPGKGGRQVSVATYKIAQRIYGFN